MLEVKHLKTIRALAQTGSLAKSADWLHTTPSALSHQLKELESRVGNPVYVRKTSPVKFTVEGELLLKLANDILPKIQDTEARIQDIKHQDKGQLRLAIECHSCFQWLMPAISQFHASWPMVELNFDNEYTFDAMPGLTQGDLDLVITADKFESDEFYFEPLFSFQMVLVTAPTHPFAQLKFISAEDLASQTLLTYPVAPSRLDIFKYLLHPANCQPAKIKTVDQTLMILQMVTANLGVAALPSWAVTEYEQQGLVKTVALGESGIQSKLYAAVKKREKNKAYIRSFFEISKTVSLNNLKQVKPLND
ncbi:LysR substrate-binding domain-containing protein [Catenovulum sp. 2E275]|uniref:LysR substrate-binding domain-containing protein n=1 Tax=Catenovulum sp. 2E275 TaxID=2980497 RepID=UPI0021D00581|nr:LysR substrate-binding domain-containing protein [Catenovulum sp. 2E275]MCU4674872.1 LysR substrate-binding domain-containing protein [Catenovulum sp. 2E275]